MQIPSGYCQVNLLFTGAGAPNGSEVTFGVANATAKTLPQVATAVINAINTSNLMFSVSNTLTLSGMKIKAGPNATGPMIVASTSLVGGNNNAPCPPNVGWLITKQTASGGRHNRGRMFLPGVASTAVGPGGVITSAYQTQIAGELASLLSELASHDVPMVLLHGDATAPTPVTFLGISSTVATQRRRLRG